MSSLIMKRNKFCQKYYIFISAIPMDFPLVIILAIVFSALNSQNKKKKTKKKKKKNCLKAFKPVYHKIHVDEISIAV